MSLAVQDKDHPLPESVLGVVADAARLAAVAALNLDGSASDRDLDRIAQLTAALFDAPLALVTILERDRQSFLAAVGTERREAAVETSFCAHALATGDVLVVEDAARDPRFAANPWVSGPPRLRFYVGVPLTVAGQPVGTLCAYDVTARPRPAPSLIERFRILAELASSLLALKDMSRAGQAARTALAREEKRRGLALEAAGLASWVWDVPTGIVECDPLLPRLFDLPPGERVEARALFHAIDRRDLKANRDRFRDALNVSGEYSGEYRVRDTDPPRWLGARGRVVERDAQGRATLVFGVNFDITERKAAEERQRLLLRELNHRVKNTLATVQALASQTVRHSRNPRDFLEAFSARLQALGAAHNLLSDGEWRGIAIRELVLREVKPFDGVGAPRIDVAGEDVMLPPDQALGLGLILHELASNALKYGSLSAPGGRVSLSWQVRRAPDGRVLHLRWKEHGGPEVAPPAHHGFGSILIRRSLAKVLNSSVEHEFKPEGVEAVVTLPLNADTG